MQKEIEKRAWQEALSKAITDPDELCRELALDPVLLENTTAAVAQFSLRVPHGFLARMEKGNPNDPLLLQVLPLGLEMQKQPGFSKDALNEARVNPAPGLLHKYNGRVLLTLTGACAVNCRYCFRRHYPYEEKVPGFSQWQKALDYISADNTITEVILSGGDPLIVKDSALSGLLSLLEKISHVKRLRFHTRLPIMIPERVTDEFVSMLKASRLKSVVVLHSNHANEIDDHVSYAIKKLSGVPLLNQSVLLKGINDTAEALVNLSERLFEVNVIPYYLHLLDSVEGAAHFNVEEKTARQLWQAISNQLPGYLVPRLVREVPGLASKSIL